MVSSIDKFNKCDIDSFIGSGHEIDENHHLLKYFSKDMLDAIEVIFEQDDFESWSSYKVIDAAPKMIKQSIKNWVNVKEVSAQKVLKGIMRNIVKNKGELHFAGYIYGA